MGIRAEIIVRVKHLEWQVRIIVLQGIPNHFFFLSSIGKKKKKRKKHQHGQNSEMMCRISGIDNFIFTSLI